MIRLRARNIFSLLLISLCLLPYAFASQTNVSVKAPSNIASSNKDYSMAQNPVDDSRSLGPSTDQRVDDSFRGNITGSFQGKGQTPQFSALANAPSFTRHVMCKDHNSYYSPINPTTIFRPSDVKAECLTTVTINNTIEFRWYYRDNSSKNWVNCYNWSEAALFAGEYYYIGYLLIAGYWPESHYPNAYKVEVYLDGQFSFVDFFEVTNGGLNSPRTCENIDANWNPINVKSRFTIGTDTNVYYYLSFDDVAYFNEELGCSHNFTVSWIQPDGSTYETFSRRFSDYKDTNVTWTYWKHGYANDSYILINATTPVGEWKVEVFLDEYYFNGTWIPYGPVATTPFVVGSQPVADWTFMVYLDADNSLEPAGIETFLNMASVGSSSQVNIVVQMDRIGIDSRYGNWTDCKRFYVTKDMTPSPENASLDLGEVDMGDPETLRDFVNWTMNEYPANRYFLVLWDHGAGFMGLCFDATSSNDGLTLPELRQALEGLPAMIDVVLADACSTSMIELAYQIKDCANVLIGPEDLGYEPAPYQDYLSSLITNSSMSPTAFTKVVVADYINWCNSIPNIQNATMSATDLTKTTSLIMIADDFALELEEKENLYHEQISLARSLTQEYQGPYADQTGSLIDLYHFAQLISQYIPDVEIRDTANRLMGALSVGNSTIIEANKALWNSHGLSIFFPDENGKYQTFRDTHGKTDFGAETLWDRFIENDLSGFTLTIQTSEPNVPVELDNDSYMTDNSGKIRLFVPAQYHTVNLTSFIQTEPGSRDVFSRWNDGDTSNPRTLFVNEALTLTAEYETQYRLLIDGNFGTTSPVAGENWYKALSTVQIGATAPTTSTGERYTFLGWAGEGYGSYSGSDNSVIITMNEPINETATWRHEYYLTVSSVHGSPTITSGWFETGEFITASVTSPWPGPTDTQYVCTGWNCSGNVSTSGATLSVNLTISQASSITWNWKTQYEFVIGTNPAGLSPQPTASSAGPWYDEGSVLTCAAQNVSGKVFDHWTVISLTTNQSSDYEQGMSRINVPINGPYEAVAHYTPAPAWWDSLLRPENLLIIFGLGGILTVSCAGAVWFRTRRKKVVMRPPAEPAIKIPETKDFLPGRVSTGCDDLDSVLFGGLPKNYAVTLTSPSCDERDLLINRFLEAGAKNGEVTFYLTDDPGDAKSLAEEFQSNFYLFICNPRADAMAESLPNVFKLRGVENLNEITIALTKAFRTLEAQQSSPRRACVGIVSDVLLQHHAVQTRRWLSDLIPELKSKGFTTLAVMNPQMHPPEEVQAILELFEGEIGIHEKEGLQRTLRIKKMYNQKYLDCELPLKKEK